MAPTEGRACRAHGTGPGSRPQCNNSGPLGSGFPSAVRAPRSSKGAGARRGAGRARDAAGAAAHRMEAGQRARAAAGGASGPGPARRAPLLPDRDPAASLEEA